MGMYTGLRVKAKIKEEFLQQLEAVLSAGEGENWKEPWSVVDFVKFPFVEKFSKNGQVFYDSSWCCLLYAGGLGVCEHF